MKDAVDSFARGRNRSIIAKIAPYNFDTLRSQLWILAAGETSDLIATRDESFNNVSAQETAAAGNECSHRCQRCKAKIAA
jgi:hypothetical protein